MSDPAKDPDTCAVPPAFGRVKPPPPEELTPTEYPESVTALGCTVVGIHVTSTEIGLEVSRLVQALDAVVRVEAIDALSPGGDTAAADKLDKLVAADKASGDKNLAMGDDAVVKVAGRLRARALP